ncbi:hypothetical protein GE061_018307 [Apolygus lucorum]|uniref:Uncharacterized protein n=1 Tax=Apolygus lucorum TaxID=248454 RepID=A0A6A4JJA2_APOLU|nr:hypothetical protein GE061_018307 [Apolygus lucorum]
MGMSQRKMSRVSERVKQFDRVSVESEASVARPAPRPKPPRKRLSRPGSVVSDGRTPEGDGGTPCADLGAPGDGAELGKLRRSEPSLALKELGAAPEIPEVLQNKTVPEEKTVPATKSCQNLSNSSDDDKIDALQRVVSNYELKKADLAPETPPPLPSTPPPASTSDSVSPPPSSPSLRSTTSQLTLRDSVKDVPDAATDQPRNGVAEELPSVTSSVPLPYIDESSVASESPVTSPKRPVKTPRKLVTSPYMKNVKIGDRDYIGFATLPEQIHRKSVKRGFDFTLMVVGESGLGKSTLVNSLFLSDLYKDRKIPEVADKLERTTTIERKTMDIEERGVKLRLTVVDTPGFGDALNCDDSWKVVVNYIDDQFRQYFTDESGLNRKNIQDNRVHCCLYFIPPYGHGLRQIDVELMKRLHQKVNIVPVIGKADALTLPEIKKLKQRILDDIGEHGIQIYQFPECDSDEDEEFKQQDRELKASLPFSVIGSNTVIEVGGSRTRGRQYPWGVVEVENPKHSDFNKLRNMLITTHMQDLKDVTEDVHYENFRAQCISQISQQAFRERGKLKRDSVPPNLDPTMITETDRLLLQKDEEIRRMQDMLAQMQQKLKATTHSNDNIVNI